jgi:hypothetical protein
MEVNSRFNVPAALLPGWAPGTRCIGGWEGPRTGLDTVAKTNPIIAYAGNWTPLIHSVA